MSEYVFPKGIPIDTAHTLDQLTGRFQSVADGLPELVKNSKDQYSRLGVIEPSERQILVISNKSQRMLAVIDFAGARRADFEGWTTWSSRFAGRSDLANDIEAGHGNGGKAFMVRGATHAAFLESCFEGRLTRMGFQNDVPSNRYKPGHAKERGRVLDDIVETVPKARLTNILSLLGMKFDDLPAIARAAFEARQAFTVVVLDKVLDWVSRQERTVNRLATDSLVELIANHGQTAQTVETCQVWVICDGKVVGGSPVKPVALEPYPSFAEPRIISIPEHLVDPETGEGVIVPGWAAETNFLRLCTSRRQLQMSSDTKTRNVIRIWNRRNNVANWPLQSLGILVTSVSFIYGELRCPGIEGEHLAGSERLYLADTPLVRAIQHWTARQIEALANLLHRAMMAESKPRDREQANAALKNIRELMRKYLETQVSGSKDDNDGEGGNGIRTTGQRRTRATPKVGTRLDEIVLENGKASISLAHGSRVPLVYHCIQRDEDGSACPVPGTQVTLQCSISNFVDLDDQGRLIGLKPGTAKVSLQSDCGVKSNEVVVEVVTVSSVDVIGPDDPLLQGQRIKLPIIFRSEAGARDDLLIDASVDEPGMGLIGRNGRFTAGLEAGQATVRVHFGPNPAQQTVAILQVGDERMPVAGQGGDRSDIPEILLCGDRAPGMEEYPPAQRTHPGGDDYPTIIEEPQFRNIVWINPNSKEAMRVRRSRGGPSGIGSIASSTFMQFVALKCFEVLKRLYVRQQIRDRSITETEFIQHAALAEIECAAFIDAAWELTEALRENLNARALSDAA